MQTKMCPVLLWTMPPLYHHASLETRLIITPFVEGEPIERYGGEAYAYRKAKADFLKNSPGGAPLYDFNTICQMGPRVFYGEPLGAQAFFEWYVNLPEDSHLRVLYNNQFPLNGSDSTIQFVKVRKDFYFRLLPGDLIELIEFGVIETTHSAKAQQDAEDHKHALKNWMGWGL